MWDIFKGNSMSDLTQEEVLGALLRWYNNPDKGRNFARVTGAGGTGKTTLAKNFLADLKKTLPFLEAVCSAPTHKAVGVLENFTGEKGVTLQSLLGLQPGVHLDSYDPKAPMFKKTYPAKIGNYDLVFIDESSMINKELLEDILSECRACSKTKILFIGDPVQLPPVNEGFSPVFDPDATGLGPMWELTIPMRQEADSSLFNACSYVRTHIEECTEIAADNYNARLPKLSISKLATEDDFTILGSKNNFIAVNAAKALSQGVNCKALCYTNASVESCNMGIRSQLGYPFDVLIRPGDRLFGYSPTGGIINGYDYLVESCELDGYVYNTVLTPIGAFEEDPIEVPILNHLDDEAMKWFSENTQKLSAKAKRSKGGARKEAWRAYYSFLGDALPMTASCFAPRAIGYGYAITIHKSQGSTYDEVHIKYKDLQWCRSELDKKKLMYVAMTRPRTKCTVYA